MSYISVLEPQDYVVDLKNLSFLFQLSQMETTVFRHCQTFLTSQLVLNRTLSSHEIKFALITNGLIW